MASFSSLPVKIPARKRIFRQARTGARLGHPSLDLEAALGAVDSVAKYTKWFDRQKPNVEFFDVLEESWEARKDHLP